MSADLPFSCRCGTVRGTIEQATPLEGDFVVCHCTDCQIMSGAPLRAVVFSETDGFKLLTGELKIYVKTAESGNPRQQAFCPECGTPIYATNTGDGPKNYGIRLGAIRQRGELTPKAQVWTRSAQYWLAGLDGIRKIETQPALPPK